MERHLSNVCCVSATWRLVSQPESNQKLFACVVLANSIPRLQMVCF